MNDLLVILNSLFIENKSFSSLFILLIKTKFFFYVITENGQWMDLLFVFSDYIKQFLTFVSITLCAYIQINIWL